MQFQIKCATFVRLASICNFFESHISEETKQKCNTLRLEISKGKVFAIATNVKIAAIEWIGNTTEKDGVAHIILDPAIVNQCKAEAWFDGVLTINTIPEIAIANASTSSGWVYPTNACYWFDETPLDKWREWAPEKMATKSSGIMWWNLFYVEALLASAFSGKIVFPEFINTKEPIVLRDRDNPNWVGLFLADPTPYEQRVTEPATLPEWWNQ